MSNLQQILGVGLLAAIASGAAWGQCELQELHEASPVASNGLGSAVSIDGDVIAAGTPGDDTNGSQAGSVTVFLHDGLAWAPIQKLVPKDVGEQQRFGRSVNIAGNIMLVGAPSSGPAGRLPGWAYVYRRNKDVWLFEQKLLKPGGMPADEFGIAVAVLGDLAFVGARESIFDGSVTVYRFDLGTSQWLHEQELAASDAQVGYRFGKSLAFDGATLMVGATMEALLNGPEGGAVYVFAFNLAQGVWVQQQKLTASDGEAPDSFGEDVAFSGDLAVIGADGDDNDGGGNAGAAYVFQRIGGLWMEQAKLVASDGAANDVFGRGVGISLEGVIFVGAPRDDDNGSAAGVVYVFEEIAGHWVETGVIRAGDTVADDLFGNHIAVGDGLLIISAHSDDDGGEDAGSVYVFDLNPCPCPADANGDGFVNVLDLIDLLLCFGQAAIPDCVGEDINEDGVINVLDLIDLLLAFGTACP